MTSYRAPRPYHERKHSWEEPGLMPPRRDHEDYLYGRSLPVYGVDSSHPLYDQDENCLENGRRDYVEYRDDSPDLREREGNYRHFEREDRKSPLQDFRRNEESARGPYPESSRNSRFYDNLDEYIREQRELMNADYIPRGKNPGERSLLDLEPLIYEDDRSRDHDRDGGNRSRGNMFEERSRDHDHRSRHDDSDDDYHCGDYSDYYRRDESRSRMEELDYRDNVTPRRRDYHRQPARSDPYYQRDCRNEHDMRDEDILYGYRDRHRRSTEREFRKQINEYNSHERANSLERDRGRRGRAYSYVDRDKYPISSRMVHNERPTRSDVRSYENEPQRVTERVESRCKRERRSSREEYAPYPSRQTRRARGGRPSRSPCTPSKAYSNSSSPGGPSPTSSGRVPTRDKYPKRKMSMYEVNGTKRRKCDGRQTNASPKKQETPSTELITRDQFLSRDVFNSKKHSSRVPEEKSTKTKDLGFRDSTSSRHSCGERDLRHELSESRAAASGTKSLHLGDSSDFEERSSTASSTRIIDSESSAIRSIVQVPKKKSRDPNESRTKIKKEVDIYSDPTQTKSGITPDTIIKPLAKQVSTPSSAELLPVNTATGQPVRTSEGLKRKVSICPTRTPSPLLGAVEKPKVELPADDLRLLIMSRRLRQSEETTPSLDDNLNHKSEELAMLPQMEHPQCQVSNQRQGSADGMVELSYSDPEGSANEDSAPPTPKGQACRTVVMRRQVILDYGQERSHPRSPHQSPNKDKGKENKAEKEKESSATPNAVVEVVSQGAANPPVLTNRPLYKDEDSKILSTVEVVDNSPESLDSHAADESQTSEESIRDSFFGHTTADAANSSVVYTQKYGYLQQIEDVSNPDYNSSASGDKYQEAKENVVGGREGGHFEESNGTWTTSTGHYEIERQTYQELGHFEEEIGAVRENTSLPHEHEQQSISHYDQEFSQEDGHCRGESDAVREDLPDYNGEEQHIPHYGQEYSQELVYNTEVGDDLREDLPDYNGEEHPILQYEQEYSQELVYKTEVGDDFKEGPSDYNGEEQHIPHYGQEYSQELVYNTEVGDDFREDPADYNGEEQHIPHYGQEYSQELVYNTEVGDDLREDPSECYEEQHIPQYEQEYSEELGYDTAVDVDVREDPSECYEEQHIPQYEQEYSQELGYDTAVGVDVREDPSECYEEQHIPQYEQEYSQELGYDTAVGVDVRENPSECYEEQHIPQYEQEYSQELGYDTAVGVDVREDPSECFEEQDIPQYEQYEQEYSQELVYNTEVGDDLRKDPPDYNGEEQPIPQYEQEYSREPGNGAERSDFARERNPSENDNEGHPLSHEVRYHRKNCGSAVEDRSEHGEDQDFSRYEQEYSREHGCRTEESVHARENPLENHSISHYEQESYQEVGGFAKEGDAVKEGYSEHYDNPSTRQYDRPSFLEHDYFQEESDAWRKNSLGERPEQQSRNYKQKYSQEPGSCNDENDDVGNNISESYEEQQSVSHYEQGISQDVGKEDGSEEIRQNSSESYEEDQPVLDYEKEAGNSDSTGKDNESSLETFQEEKDDDNEQESAFSELEQFAGVSNIVSEGFSEQEDLSCDYDEESSDTGDDDKSFSSGEESYQSTTDEVKYCLKEDSNKKHENDVSEGRHDSYDNNVFSEALFSGYKASDGSEYSLLTSSHQYEQSSDRYIYDDDSEEETPEMSNGFDVILALDSVDYDETDDDMKQKNPGFDKRGICRQDEVAGACDPFGEETITQVHGHGFLHEVDDRGSYDEKRDGNGKHDVVGTNIAEMEDEGQTQTHTVAEESVSEFTPIIGKEDLNQSEDNAADKIATTINHDHSASECEGIGRFDEDPDAGKEDVNVSDETATQDNGGSISYDSSNECAKRGIPDDRLNTDTEESYQNGEHHSLKCENEKCQKSDGCEIQCLGLKSLPCNIEETEAQKSRPPNLKWSSMSEHDEDLPTRDYSSGNANENAEQQQANQSTDLLNKSSGSEYDRALPTKDSGCVNKQNSYRRDGHALQEANPSSDLLNRSSGSEYDPALPTKDYDTLTRQKRYAGGEDDLETLNHSAGVLNTSSTSSEYDPSLPTKDYGNIGISNRTADILNISTSSGSEYDPAKPIKDNVSSQVTHLVIDSEELRHLADRYKSSSSEYDTISTKDCDVTMEEDDDHNDDAFQELPHPDQDVDNCSSSEIVVCMPEESDVTHEQDYFKDDVIEELRHPDLDKVSGSVMDLHTPTKDCAVTNQEEYHRQNVTRETCHPVHCGKSNGSENGYMLRNDVTNEQDSRSDDVIHNIRSPDDNKSSGSENVPISTDDCDVTYEQSYLGDDVIQNLRSSGVNKNSSSGANIHIPTNDYNVAKEQDHDSDDVTQDLRSSLESGGEVVTKYCDVKCVQNNPSDDVIQVSDMDKSIVSKSTDCDITDEHDFQSKDVTQELRQSHLNGTIEDKPPLPSKIDNISKSDELMEVAYPGSFGAIAVKVGAHQSPAESSAIPVVHNPPDAQAYVIVSCNSDTTSVCPGPSYEVVVEEECRVLGATAEIFLSSDIDANHICIYECVDFQLLCVNYPAPTTGDQEPKKLYHNLQTDVDVRQKDLPSGQITPAISQGSSYTTVAAPVLRKERVIEERRVVQNQVHLICSPINDEDQISSQEESSRSRLNAMKATSQNAVEWESVEHGNPVDEENPAITLSRNNTGMSQKSCSSRGEDRKEIDDPDLMYLDEVQYFEGEQPIGKSGNTGKAKNSKRNISAEDVPDDTCGSEGCDSSNDSTGEMSLYSTETNVSEVGSSTSQSEMMLKLRQEFERWTQNDGQQGSDYLFSETNYSCLSDSPGPVIQDQPYDPECASLNQVSFSDMSSDAVRQVQPYDPECASLNQVSFSDISSDAVRQVQPYDPECASLNQVSFSDMSSDAVVQDQPYDPECASLSQVSFSDISSDAVVQDQPYDPECVSLSDMSLETPSTSSHVSPKCSQVPACVSLKTQRAVSTKRTSSSKPSPRDISLYSQTTTARVPNTNEESDLKSRKPYDPANCLMDVDTFSELSGMSLDTPSSSAVEYVATEADTTLVGMADDDSEPYTPEAYSPVLSLSGDESDPELFSCMDDAFTPYNHVSHCPADMSMSNASGNEADNEVSTGFSSPEFSTNERKRLSLKLKKPSAQKLRWSYVGNSSKESSNDETWQKNPEVYSPEGFDPLFKPAAGGKSSNRKSARIQSRSKSDDVERRKQQKGAPKDKKCSVENKKPCALPSSSEKSERSRGKDRKSKEEHTTTGSKRKPLKSLVTVVGTNKRVKEDEVKKKVDRHADTKTKKKSATKGHNSKAVPKIPKEKESVKRPAVSETNDTEATRERSTPPLKKPKLSSRCPTERRHSSGPPGADTTQKHKKKPSEGRNNREEKFKKPVSPGKCKRRRKSSERAKDAGQKTTTRKSSEVRRKGCSKAGTSFPVLDKLKTIMRDKSSKGTKSPESSTATKNTPTKAEEPIDELHLLDEGHELLELAFEESINRSRADKSLCAKKSLNLAEKVGKMKRKLAETEEVSGNENINSTQCFKPSEQETQVQLSCGLDNVDDKGVGKVVKALSEASLDSLKAANQNSPVRLMNDNCKSMELAVKCSRGETDAIDKDLGREHALGVVAFQEKKSDAKKIYDDDCGWVTNDNGIPANKNVVSSAIEKLEDSKAEMHSATVTKLCPTKFQESVGEAVEVNIISSDNEKQMNKQDDDGIASDKEDRSATSTNPGSARSEENGKILIADKSRDNESDTVGEHDHKTRETSDSLNVAKETYRENEINSCKEDDQEISAEDSCKISEEVTNTLSASSVISSTTSKCLLSQGKSSRKVCGQLSEMSGRQLAEDKAGKTVIADYEVGEAQIDRLSKDQDEKPSQKRRGNEKHEIDQDKDDGSKDGVPNMEENVAENIEIDQKSNGWSTESISDMTGASCTSTSRNAEKLKMAVKMKTSYVGKKTDDENADTSPNNDEQGVTCLPTLQRSSTNKENQFVINTFSATIERELIIPYHDKDEVDGGSSGKGAAKSLATPGGISSTPHAQTKAVSSTSSGVSCTQMISVADDSLSNGKLSTPEAQPEDDDPLTPIGIEVGDPCIAIRNNSVGPSAPVNNLSGKQAGRDGKAQDSEVVTSSGQSLEERRGVKSEISLEEYIETQLQHGLNLPDISVSKVSSETIPSLRPISFPGPTATSNVSNNNSLSHLKLPLPSSATTFQKTDLSPASSKVEKGSCLLSEESKETPPAPSARGERSELSSPRMDIVKSLTAEYEQKIIAILQKRVDVEKAYREECAKIVTAVKALARKKKNMERELRDVLQTSLREISQKYISELQRFVRNETI